MTAPRHSNAVKRAGPRSAPGPRARSRARQAAPFRGRFAAKLDEKGRLTLPSAVRAALGGSAAVVTNSLHQNKPCLHLLSAAGWAALERRIARLPTLRPEVQAFQRYYLSGGQEIDVDSQGRMLAPYSLREHAGLRDAVVLVGMGAHLEIWSADAWNEIERTLAKSFEATMAAIAAIAATDERAAEDDE